MVNKIKTLWGEKTQDELLQHYDFLSYFYWWIEMYLNTHINNNPDEKRYSNDETIQQYCIEVYEEQYKSKENGNRIVPDDYRNWVIKNG